MRRAWVAAIVLFLVVSAVVTASVWAIEVTVGGDFRFRARQRSDFDLQAFNRNAGPLITIGNGVAIPFDNLTYDAPVGANTYGGSILMSGVVQNFNGVLFNNLTGQFVTAFPAAPRFLFDGTAAEEHFGYNFATGRLNVFRAASVKHQQELSRPHADVGNDDRDYIYDRIRVSIDAKIVEGLRAYVMFENYSDWGLNSTTATNEPRTFGGNGSSSIYGDRDRLNLRFAWVDFVIPKTPIHVKIGRQPIRLGHGILLDTTLWGGDIAYVYAPVGPVTLGALYGKFIENNRANADDANFFGVHADFAINPANKVSTFYRYVWNRLGRYNNIFPNVANVAATATFANVGAAANRNQQFESNQHGWGITADGKVGPLFYALEADLLWGQYTNWTEPRKSKPRGYWDYLNARTPLQMQEDLYQVAWGYGVQLGVDFKWVKFDVAHSWGSGDKTRASSTRFFAWDGRESGLTGLNVINHHQWTTGRRVEAFDAWGGDNAYSPWTTDIFLTSAKSANFGGVGLGTNGFTRRWFYGAEFGDVIMVKPTLTVKPFENLTGDISYAAFWKTANTNNSGAGMGAVADGEPTSIILWKSNANNREQPNKQKINPFLGQEINAHLTWYPYKNLMVKGWFGVFFPGDWFKVQQRNHSPDAIFFPLNADGHDTVGLRPAWALQLDIIVTF